MPPASPSPPAVRMPLYKWLGMLVLLALVYSVLGRAALFTTSTNGHFSVFWPASGVAIAALYLFGLRLWPAVFIGAFIVSYLTYSNGATSALGTVLPARVYLPMNVGVAIGSTLEAIVGAWLLRRSRDFSPNIGRVRDALQLLVYAGVLASLLSACIGIPSLIFGGVIPRGTVFSTFILWWTGNLLGILILAPAILSWTQRALPKLSTGRRIEAAVVFLVGGGLASLIFCWQPPGQYFSSLPYLIFFFVTWTALRFGQRASTSFVCVVTILIMWGVVHGTGSFGGLATERWDSTLNAQIFIIVCAVVSMLVSATTTNLFERSRRLEHSERRYRELFNSGPEPMWIYSPQNEKILAVNESAISRLGYSREEFLKLSISDLFLDSTALPKKTTRLASKTSPLDVERASLKNRSGTPIPVELSARSADFFGESAIQLLAQDVTVQVQTENDLRKSEQKLNIHIQQTALGVIEWNEHFEVNEWNPAAERIFGFSKAEALGKNGIELIVPPDVRPDVRDVWVKITVGSRPVRSINDNITKSGDLIRCEWFNTPLVDKVGTFIGAASLVQDVTLRESIEESVRESEEKFRSVIESSPMGIQIYEMKDADKLILIGANPAAQDFMGFKNEEVLGKTIEEAFPALAGTDIPRMYRRAASKGKASWTDQVFYHEGELNAAYEVNAFQTVPGKMVAMFLNVTERRRTEQALRLRDKAMEAISQGIVIIAGSIDGSLPIIYANPAFEKITGYSLEQIVGKSWKVLTGAESETGEVRALEKAIARERPVSVEMRSYRQDGTTFQSSISISPIVDADGRVSHYVGVYTDVTSIKKLETQFRQSQKMEAIGRLAGGVAHDFNNLLTAIIGYNDINLSMMERDTMLCNNSAEIQKAAERAASLTGQMLAFSRQQNLQPTRVALNKAIGGMYQMLARLIGETIEIRTLLDDNLADIKAGSSQIEQVILNLAINARDAMPTGGVLSIRTANTTVGTELVADIPGITPGDYVLLSLSDTGTGMDDHTKEHLFEPFFTTKEKGKGTGLGLATCYGIIVQSSGFVAVHTKLGRGTTFDIYFPKMPSDGVRETNRFIEVKVQGGAETLLVVEDDPAVRPLTTNILRTLGYTVLEAGNGIEAQDCLSQLNGTQIDLLLTDVVMPKMGGKELADWMKVSYPSTKILFASGYLENMLSRDDIGDDEAFFLRKPFTARTLAKKVRDVLDRREIIVNVEEN